MPSRVARKTPANRYRSLQAIATSTSTPRNTAPSLDLIHLPNGLLSLLLFFVVVVFVFVFVIVLVPVVIIIVVVVVLALR